MEAHRMISPATAQTFEKINPSTGERLAEYPIATTNEVQQVVAKSKAIQPVWANSTLKVRAKLLRAIANALYQQADSLAETVSQEIGKPLSDAKESDLGIAISILHYYADVGPNVLKPQGLHPDLMSVLAGRTHQEVFHARGVIGIIAPWNFPLAIPASGIAAALMSGNTILLKPSELAPETGKRLVELIQAVCKQQGLSEDLVQLVLGNGATGAALVQTDIDGMIFTGSARVGQEIARQSAERGRWYSLELGGSDAMIVLNGCNLEQAASYALWGRFTNAGQACAAVKRLLVPEQHLNTMTAILKDKIHQLQVGSPSEAGSQMGPLISEAQLQILETQVQDALQQGTTLITGGTRLERPGYFYAPTLLKDVPAQARIIQEEVFGPVLPIVPYQTVNEAIQFANQSAYGLTASIFGPVEQAEAVAKQLQCGTVIINDIGASNYAMSCAPWGGWKQSGYGVSHGIRTLQELTQRKIISHNRRFHWPVLNKPLWLFAKSGLNTESRSHAVLAFASRSLRILNPKTWLAFWQHRSSTRI